MLIFPKIIRELFVYIIRVDYFYSIIKQSGKPTNHKPQIMNRMNLDQLITFFTNEGNKHAANFFESMESESQVEDGFIELEVVKRYCLINCDTDLLWRTVQANCVSYIGCTF